MTPFWSVVVPTRNRRCELCACLGRLAPGAQTLAAEKYEVIVSDDGDFDATDRWLRSEFAWARHVRGPRRGPAANRNSGARAARGEWLAFADDDVLPSPNWLASYSSVVSRGSVLEGRTTCEAGVASPRMHAPENNDGGALWSCNFAIRREVFDAIGGFDEGFIYAHMEDADIRERLRATGHALVWVADAIVDHPPRRLPSGTQMGAYRAAEVRYLYKHGAPRPVWRRLIRSIIASRLVNIRARPKGVDSLLAVWALAAEACHVALHARAWEREGAREFPSAERR